MQTPVHVTFRGVSPSPSVEACIQRWVDRLAHDNERLQRCSVLVELPHQHHRHGKRFHVRIDLTVPGRELAVSRDPELDPGHEDVYVAVADAFRAARRQLHDHAQIRRGDVKNHVT